MNGNIEVADPMSMRVIVGDGRIVCFLHPNRLGYDRREGMVVFEAGFTDVLDAIDSAMTGRLTAETRRRKQPGPYRRSVYPHINDQVIA